MGLQATGGHLSCEAASPKSEAKHFVGPYFAMTSHADQFTEDFPGRSLSRYSSPSRGKEVSGG